MNTDQKLTKALRAYNNVLCANDFAPTDKIIRYISKTASGSTKTNKKCLPEKPF